VNVTDLVDEIHDMFAAKAKEREIELSAEVDDNFPELSGDPQDMYRALMNLVSNAIKFTPKGGKVAIQTEVDPKDNTFIMVVRDSGVGMTRDQIEQVTSSNDTTVSPHGDIGTGQGLTIVNSIVTELGGQLKIISTENRGTKIKMRFPKSVSIPGL
ncbi:MAG: HAMP domain-containing histidine kinase, partial [Magnetovibrio sp.]|nr:HAMP domain-containing histidine kinase [Magnetovibrio sp.]